MIFKTLKTSVKLCGPNLGFGAKGVSAWSLNAASAMALLYYGIKSNIIKLIGRWRINKMLLFLHIQAEPVMSNFYSLILAHGNQYF